MFLSSLPSQALIQQNLSILKIENELIQLSAKEKLLGVIVDSPINSLVITS